MAETGDGQRGREMPWALYERGGQGQPVGLVGWSVAQTSPAGLGTDRLREHLGARHPLGRLVHTHKNTHTHTGLYAPICRGALAGSGGGGGMGCSKDNGGGNGGGMGCSMGNGGGVRTTACATCRPAERRAAPEGRRWSSSRKRWTEASEMHRCVPPLARRCI